MRCGADGRRLDGEFAERVLFALVDQRALEPGSKLAASGWAAARVAIEGLAWFSGDQAYRAMDFLLEVLEEIAAEIFDPVATRLNLATSNCAGRPRRRSSQTSPPADTGP